MDNGNLETIREIPIQSLAFVLGALRIVNRFPQVKLTNLSLNVQLISLQFVSERSVERREISPEFLHDPLLGQHSYVKINVSRIYILDITYSSKYIRD